MNTAPRNVFFILHYHLFFRKDLFFECLYFSEYDIRMFLFVFWLRKRHPLTMYVTRGMEGDHPKCLQMRTGGEGITLHVYVRALTLSLFIFLSYDVLFYLLKFNLTFIQKGVFARNGYFSPIRLISAVMK